MTWRLVGLSSATSTRAGGIGGSAGRAAAGLPRSGGAASRARRGNPEAEGAAEARHALDRDLAAHQLDQLARDGEAEAGAAAQPGRRAVDLGEALEEMPLGRFRDADAGVAHRDLRAGRRPPGRSRGSPRRCPPR